MFEVLISFTLALGSFFAFVVCSKPKNLAFVRWLQIIRRDLRNSRRRNDHIRAAVILRIIDRKARQFPMRMIQKLFSRLKSENNKSWFNDKQLWAVLLIFGPYFMLAVFGVNQNSAVLLVSSYIFAISLIFMAIYLNVMGATSPDVRFEGESVRYKRVSLKLKPWVLLTMPVSLVAGIRFRFIQVEGKPLEVCVTERPKQLALFFIAFGISTFVVIHKLFLNILALSPQVFYPLLAISGPAFFLFVGTLVYLGITLVAPNRIQHSINALPKKAAKGAMYLSMTATVTLLLYYTAKFESSPRFDTSSAWLVYVNILCDIYVIYLFNQIVKLIALTRRQSNRYSAIILREYILFIIRSLVASLISIYLGFLFTETPLGFSSSIRLLVGLNPFGEGVYLGAIFWLVHSSLLPALAILTFPVLLIAKRVWHLFINKVVLNVLRSGQPVIYMAAALIFFGSVADLILVTLR